MNKMRKGNIETEVNGSIKRDGFIDYVDSEQINNEVKKEKKKLSKRKYKGRQIYLVC
jgi:hypothetical protein